ncbi:hypothetical protein HAX54_021812, partial [Datura stramonium]|nr:hypothetical protein [Datura stramonium]
MIRHLIFECLKTSPLHYFATGNSVELRQSGPDLASISHVLWAAPTIKRIYHTLKPVVHGFINRSNIYAPHFPL